MVAEEPGARVSGAATSLAGGIPGARDAPRTTDFLVVGGGIMGIALALELKHQYADCRVTLIEKEPCCGAHASGRNSGVLHAGFYYTADSLKARFTREGNRRLAEYCDARGLPIDRCGKVVVARGPADLAGLEELLRRGRKNGVLLEVLSPEDARRLEPQVKTRERALYSPTTAVVDPGAVVASLALDLQDAGVTLVTGTAYRGRTGAAVQTSAGAIAAGFVVNAAGVYADRIARDFGFGARYRILPFKGLYLVAEPGRVPLRTLIYPVPELAYPFLGVHITLTIGGAVKLGPTATPAYWREQYDGWGNFNLPECLEVLAREAGLFLRNDGGFRRLALRELGKRRPSALVAQAAELAQGIRPQDFQRWGRPGIRAQLYDCAARRLEMDFRYEGDDRSLHVLNAVSPAFTCALPLAAHLVDRIAELVA